MPTAPSDINITLGNTLYQGVMVEQTMEPSDDKVVAFTAMAKNGVSIWGYKYAEATGIQRVTRQSDDSDYYDLRGMKVANPQKKGIYIKNGKKIVVK